MKEENCDTDWFTIAQPENMYFRIYNQNTK